MSKIEVNTVAPQCGTTLTLGESGDTVTLGAGASQSGFGRTGTVDWQTGSIKTSTFTAANGEGYFANTSGGEFTMNLPAGTAGAIVAVADYTRTFATNRLTVTPNGSEKIGGVAASIFLNVNGQALTLVYVDATEGWINVQNAEDTEEGIVPAFITATGGTITTVCTNYKVHTFTGPGTFTVCSTGNPAGSDSVDYLVIAGGASGGGEQPNSYGSGGGGAGGYRESSGTASGSYTASPLGACVSALPVTAQGYPITVGGGGAARTAPTTSIGNAGSNSVFSTITSTGGGGGGTGPGGGTAGANGGSGGGAAGSLGTPFRGTGNTPPVSPPQGNPGGAGQNTPYVAGGGGGATLAGSDGNKCTPTGGPGGTGATSSINGTPTARAGGGGGGVYLSGPGGDTPGSVTVGSGGTGGGGNGGNNNPGTDGGANTGGGGGGAGSGNTPTFSTNSGGGGSGIIMIRYRFQ